MKVKVKNNKRGRKWNELLLGWNIYYYGLRG